MTLSPGRYRLPSGLIVTFTVQEWGAVTGEPEDDGTLTLQEDGTPAMWFFILDDIVYSTDVYSGGVGKPTPWKVDDLEAIDA